MLLLALILALLATAPGAFAVTPAISGAEPGVWTQDYDAAIALARSRSLPAIINFTGSDWCGWCRLMDRQVFSTDAFADWARGRVVLIWIDFPSDPSLVPEKWRQRNQDLQRQHNVRGYPTYIALNSSGDVAGQLGASRDATPKAFTSRFEALVGALPPPRPAAPSLSPDPAKSLRFSSSDDALKPLVSIASDLVSRLEAATAAASASIADIRGQMARALEKGKAAAMAKGDLDAALQFDAVLKDPDASPPEPAPSLRKILSVRDKAVGDVTASLNARRASILAAALSRLDADKLRETRAGNLELAKAIADYQNAVRAALDSIAASPDAQGAAPSSASSPDSPDTPDFSRLGDERRLKMSASSDRSASLWHCEKGDVLIISYLSGTYQRYRNGEALNPDVVSLSYGTKTPTLEGPVASPRRREIPLPTGTASRPAAFIVAEPGNYRLNFYVGRYADGSVSYSARKLSPADSRRFANLPDKSGFQLIH